MKVELLGEIVPPVLYKPGFTVIGRIDDGYVSGGVGYVAEVPAGGLPDYIYAARASTNTSNGWEVWWNREVRGSLDEVVEESGPRANIIVYKDAVPDDPQVFSFTGGLNNFDLDDDGVGDNYQTFTGLLATTYDIIELDTSGWNLTGVTIVDPDGESSFSLETKTATLDLDPGETITVTFTNEPANTDPYASWARVWGPGGRLDPGGTVARGNTVLLYAQVGDPETHPSLLTVTISYGQSSVWTSPGTATYVPAKNEWHVYWAIPLDAPTGVYDVQVKVSDPDGGSATAVEAGEFEVTSSVAHIFEDGFESGSFGEWDGVYTSSGETATVSTLLPHDGSYHAAFTTDGVASTARAYCFKEFSGLSEVYAQAYIYIDSGLPLSAWDGLWLSEFYDSGGSHLASYGVKADNTGTKWACRVGAQNGFGSSGPVEGGWYLVEAYYRRGASGDTVVLYVDGGAVASLAVDTSAAGDAAEVRVGIPYNSPSYTTTIYIDNVAVD